MSLLLQGIFFAGKRCELSVNVKMLIKLEYLSIYDTKMGCRGRSMMGRKEGGRNAMRNEGKTEWPSLPRRLFRVRV